MKIKMNRISIKKLLDKLDRNIGQMEKYTRKSEKKS